MRSKLYAFEEMGVNVIENGEKIRVTKNKVTKKAKGVKKTAVKNQITFQDYKDCVLHNKSLTCEQMAIRCRKLDENYS